MVGVPDRLAARSKEASQVFRTVGHNSEARQASNANRTYYCDHHQGSENDLKPALQIRLSTSVWNAKTGGIKGHCGFINGCTALSSTGGRSHSHHPSAQSAEYAQQALAYLEKRFEQRHSGLVMASHPHKETFVLGA